MKKISLLRFKEICEKNTNAKYIYKTENQYSGIPQNMNICATFDTILFMTAPNRICLKSGDDYMCFEDVQYIKKCERVGMSKDKKLYNIVCSSLSGYIELKRYTIEIQDT